ncbi:MAG: hypothetical protein GXO11_07735 [Epsilonproteobacteria bacterium]|nr:hypothetical protein [Campylobacterota bacterium]
MKRLSLIPLVVLFFGCQEVRNPSATQNDILNNVTKSSAKKEKVGMLQESVDQWQKRNIVQENKKVLLESKKEEEQQTKKRYLQELIDSTNATSNDTTPSHVKELESMPVIGK